MVAFNPLGGALLDMQDDGVGNRVIGLARPHLRRRLSRIRNSVGFEKLKDFAISGTSPSDLSTDAGSQGVDA